MSLVFPNQLLKDNKALAKEREVILVEEYLFFSQYSFHKQKLVFHRASMKAYQKHLEGQGYTVKYIEAQEKHGDVRNLIASLKSSEIHTLDPVDDYLGRRLKKECNKQNVQLHLYQNDVFITGKEELSTFFKPQRRSSFKPRFINNNANA